MKIRWGIVGAGYIAGNFVSGLKSLEDAEVAAVGSWPPGQAAQFGERFGIPRRYDSYEALAQDKEIDIFYIGTPHALHREHTLMMLEAGRPVLCEKPAAINAKQVEDMIAVARRKNIFFMEAMWNMFFPATQKALELIKGGAIGDVRMLEADFGFAAGFDPKARLFNPEMGGGSLLDVGCYGVALAQAVFGQTPERVTAMGDIGQSAVDEQAAMILGYKGGALAVLHSAIRTNTKHEAWIYGTQGMIHIPCHFWSPDRIILKREGQPDEEFKYERFGNGYTYEAIEVQKCIYAGKKENEIASHAKSIAVMRTMDRIRAVMGVKYPME